MLSCEVLELDDALAKFLVAQLEFLAPILVLLSFQFIARRLCGSRTRSVGRVLGGRGARSRGVGLVVRGHSRARRSRLSGTR